MTIFEGSILSSLAAFLMCSIQLVHASPIAEFTPGDATFIFPQFGLNPILLPPKGHEPIAQLYATGFQDYSYNGTSWVLRNATAALYNAHMEEVGIHYFLAQMDPEGGQPTWDTVDLPSLVTGRPIFSQAFEDTIAWVLLQATHSEGAANLFGKVTYVQRLYTQKGLPPTFPAPTINATYSSPYTAFYVYFKKT